jgi:hypothetical protein
VGTPTGPGWGKFDVQGLDLSHLRLDVETGGFLLQAIALSRISSNRRRPGLLSCAKTSLSFPLRG